MSSARNPLGSKRNAASAASSFSPPRLTYGAARSTSMDASAATS